jgi:3-methyladenine DNA glycosylase/8-oxoguanine DNA glycosylase
MASSELELSHVIERAQGRVLRCPTLFEDVIKTILTTNTLWAATIRMTSNLVQLYGEPLPSEPSRHAFPTPERLATLDEATLRAEARLGYRAPYVLALAQASASGKMDLEALKDPDLPTPELRKRLLAIKGVGGYAAANLLNILGRYDYLPVDSWAMKMVSQEWHQGELIGPAEVDAAFERWGKWKGLAYWFWKWKQ